LDLNGLTTSQLTSRSLAIIKEQAAIDSVCFPETMNKMLIINAPAFFSVTWRMIKGWLDPRTAAKIEVISNTILGEKRLLELVHEEQLPSDYGGKGPDTNHTIMQGFSGDALRMDSRMMYVRGWSIEVVEIHANESLDVAVYTRSTSGAKFTVLDNDKKPIADPVEVTGATNKHTITTTGHIKGPAIVQVKCESHASRFSRQHFLLVFSHFKN
jgi:hypothetical protein